MDRLLPELPRGDHPAEDPRDAHPPRNRGPHAHETPGRAAAASSPCSCRSSSPPPAPGGAGPVRPLLRQEQGQVRQLRLAGLQEPPLRGLLLPGVRAAPRAAHLLPGERLPEDLRPASSTRCRRPIPVILYKTHSEFEQTNLYPALPPGGGGSPSPSPAVNRHGPAHRRAPGPAAGADHPRDDPRLRVRHHPARIGYASSSGRIPLWVDEGLADYFRGMWDSARPHDDPRRGGHRPDAEALEGRSSRPSRAASSTTWATPASSSSSRATARRGSASSSTPCARASSAGRPTSIFKQAFRTTPEEFDDAFDKWLKERFKPFRDKQRPDDFGRNLSPNPEKTPFTQVFGFAPSPSGEIVGGPHRQPRRRARPTSCSLSTQDGTVISRTSPRASTPPGRASPSTRTSWPGGRSPSTPSGDYVGFFGRTGRAGSFFLVSRPRRAGAATIKIAARPGAGPLPAPRRTARDLRRPQGGGLGHLACLDLETRRGRRTSPRTSTTTTTPRSRPTGRLVVYERRVSGHDKIYAFPLADPQKKTQLTFGPFDDDAPDLLARRQEDLLLLRRGRRHPQPAQPRPADGGDRAVHGRASGATWRPRPRQGRRAATASAFISYFKGEYRPPHEGHGRADQGDRAGRADGRRGPRGLPARRRPPGGPGEQAEQEARSRASTSRAAPPSTSGSPRAATSSAAPRSPSPTCSTTTLHASPSCPSASTGSTTGATSTSPRRLHYGIDLFDHTQFFYPSYYYRPPTTASPRTACSPPSATGGPGLRAVPPRQVPPDRAVGRGHQRRTSSTRTRTHKPSCASRPARWACPSS